MRYAIAALLVAAVMLASVGCKSTGAGSDNKVAFLLSPLQEERYQKDKRYFEDER